MHPKLSVVICTLNRAETLQNALYSLVLQTYPQSQFEVVVVDNGSADNTCAIVRDTEKAGQLQIKYLYYEKDGLAAARNKGITTVTGNVVAFLDDDAIACRTWLSHVMATFDGDKSLDAMGGPVEPLSEINLPAWMPERLRSYLSVVTYGRRPKQLQYPRYPFGTNMAFRRDVFSKFGLFDTQFGRTLNRPFQTGEETDLFMRIDKAGGRIHYNPRARVYHTIHPQRLLPEWFFEQAYWIGVSFALTERKVFTLPQLMCKALTALLLIFFGYLGWAFARVIKTAKSIVYFKCVYLDRWGYVKTLLSSK